MNPGLANQIGAVLGFVLTLMVVSYVLKDNVLFRLAVAIFIGVAAGYAAVLVVYNVIWYQLLVPLLTDFIEGQFTSLYLVVPPILLGIWLFAKASPKLSRLGSPVVAFLVGVGAATAITGAIAGTLFPQMSATMNLFALEETNLSGTDLLGWVVNALFILLGVITSLAYFHFGVRSRSDQPAQRPLWIEIFSQIGQVFIAITFGTLFAGAYAAALAALVERVSFVWNFFSYLLGLIL
jgi:hypothetical protein